MFMLGRVFTDAFSKGNGDPNVAGNLFVPPMIGNPMGGSTSPLGAIIELGVILMTPNILTMVKELIKAPQFKHSSAVGQMVGAGTGFVRGTYSNLAGTTFQYFKGTPHPNERGQDVLWRRLFGGGH